MWSDTESKIDYLNFSEIAESISDIVSSPELLPVSIGVFGDWGAGKSTILNLTNKVLNDLPEDYIQIHFDAWLYQGYDDARASILETIADHLIKEVAKDPSLLEKAKSLAKRVNKIRALGFLADAGATIAGFPTMGAIGQFFGLAQDSQNEESIDIGKVAKDIKKLEKDGKGIIKAKESKKSPPQEISAFRKEYSELLNEINKPIVVYVDNLDRCTPVNAISTLEAIRLFLFLPNTAFIIAADEDMIRSAVQEYHKGATSRHKTDYLDKLIQVPVNVPKPGVLEIRAYLFMLIGQDAGLSQIDLNSFQVVLENSLRNAWKDKAITVEDVIATLTDCTPQNKKALQNSLFAAEKMAPIFAGANTINGNPRIVKRLLNVVKMRKKVADRRGMHLDESLITKLVIFERCSGKDAAAELYQLIDKAMGKPEIFAQLEAEEPNLDKIKLPKYWQENEDFILDWAKLPPSLDGLDLRAAAYLSRETIPMGIVNNALSPAAKELVELVLDTSTRNSPSLKKNIAATPKEELLSVMETVTDQLRLEQSWAKPPSGLHGAVTLSLEHPTCKHLLIGLLDTVTKQPWMTPILTELGST